MSLPKIDRNVFSSLKCGIYSTAQEQVKKNKQELTTLQITMEFEESLSKKKKTK
jgi:hypothetical protein